MEEKKKYIMPVILVIVIIIAIIEGIVIITMNNKYNPVSNEQKQGKMSKEEMLAIAETLTEEQIYQAFDVNEKNAKDKYIGNIYKYTGIVKEVGNDFVALDDTTTHQGAYKKIYLSENELKAVSKGQSITVIGRITAISGNAHFKIAYFVMENAFIENS